jgi:hypothetical protein
MFDMDMCRFIPASGVKEETIGSFPEYGRHSFSTEPDFLFQQDWLC